MLYPETKKVEHSFECSTFGIQEFSSTELLTVQTTLKVVESWQKAGDQMD